MADRNEKYKTKIVSVCQPYIDEPIEAVAMFQAGGRLPTTGLYALTATRLVVFDAKPKGFGWKVKKIVAEWPIGSFKATLGNHAISNELQLFLPDDGSTVVLESITLGAQGFNDELINRVVGD